MSEEPKTPRRHAVLRPASVRDRLAMAGVAVAAVGLLVAGSVLVFAPRTDAPAEEASVADSVRTPSPTVEPTTKKPLSTRESTTASPSPAKVQASGSSASHRETARAEKAAKRRSNALAKLAERVADNAAENAAVPAAVTFRVASLNLLGSSHTSAGGNKSGYASGSSRTAGAISLLNSQAVDVVGLQEFEGEQKNAFNAMTGGAWDFYTGSSSGRESIAWRTSAWAYVAGGTRLIPYFHGNRLPMPWVQLQSVATGRQIFVISIHNPTSNARRGNNDRWRDVATSLEIDWVRDLASAGYPVLLTGDFNEKVTPFCRTTSAGMVASGGGTASPCNPPAKSGIDWIFGTPDLTFSDHARIDGGTVNRVTDHPMIVATATYDGPSPRTG